MSFGLDLGNLIVHLRADEAQLLRAMDTVEKKLKLTADRMTAIGRSMTLRVTAPILALAGASGKMAISIESAFTGVKKTVEATEAEFAILRKGFEDMSLRIPLSAEALMKVGEAAGQLGIKTHAILGFTEVMAKLGVTTNLTAEDAAMQLARLANITGMAQTDFDRLGSTIVDLGNNLATTEAEIVTMALRIASAGKIAGMAESEILAIGGALSSVGVQAAVGGTSVQKIIIKITEAVIAGNKQLAIFADVANMTAKDFQKLWREDAAQAFIAFSEGIGAAGEGAFAMLKNLELADIRVLRAVLSLAGAKGLLRAAIERGNAAWKENTALTKESELRFATMASRLRLVWNHVRLAAASFSDYFLPVLLRFLDESVTPLVDGFRNLNDETKRSVVVFAAVAAAIGPVMMVTGGLLKSLAALVYVVKSLTPAFMMLAGAIASPMVVILALAAVAYTLRSAWLQNIQAIKDRFIEFGEFLKGFWDYLANTTIGKFVTWMINTFRQAFANIAKNWKTSLADIAGLYAAMRSLLQKDGKTWAEVYVEAYDKVMKKTTEFTEFTVKTYEAVSLATTAFGEATVESLETLMTAVKDQFGQDADAVIALIKTKILALQQEVPDLGVIPTLPAEDIAQVTEAIKVLTDSTVATQTEAQEMIQRMLAELDSELAIQGLINEERERAVRLEKFKSIVAKEYAEDLVKQAELIAEYSEKLNELIEGRQGFGAFTTQLKQWANDAKNIWQGVGEVATRAFDDMARSLATMLMQGKVDFKAFAHSIVADLITIIIRAQMAQAAMSLFPGWFGAPTSAPASDGTFSNSMAVYGSPEGLHDGGTVTKTGWAVVDKGETYSGVGKSLASPEPSSIEVHMHSEGTNQVVTKSEEYMLSNKRIIDVWTQDAMGGGSTARAIKKIR